MWAIFTTRGKGNYASASKGNTCRKYLAERICFKEETSFSKDVVFSLSCLSSNQTKEGVTLPLQKSILVTVSPVLHRKPPRVRVHPSLLNTGRIKASVVYSKSLFPKAARGGKNGVSVIGGKAPLWPATKSQGKPAWPRQQVRVYINLGFLLPSEK